MRASDQMDPRFREGDSVRPIEMQSISLRRALAYVFLVKGDQHLHCLLAILCQFEGGPIVS